MRISTHPKLPQWAIWPTLWLLAIGTTTHGLLVFEEIYSYQKIRKGQGYN